MWGLAAATIRSASVPTGPDFAALFLPILAGCGSAKRTDGVTVTEAAQLNAAAEKLDEQAKNAAQ